MDPQEPPALTAIAAAVYRQTARAPLTAADLAARLGADPGDIAGAVGELTGFGLVTRDGATIRALAPAAFDREIDRQDRRLRELRRTAADLDAAWITRGSTGAVDVIEGGLEAKVLIDELVATAREEIVALSIGTVVPVDPPLPKAVPSPVSTVDGERAALARGVRIRGVYDLGLLADPIALSAVQECVRIGEEARVVPGLPIRLFVFDGEVATVSAPGVGGDRRHLLVTRHRGFVSVFANVFETFWRMGVSLPAGPGHTSDRPDAAAPVDDRPDAESRRLLAHLAVGLTDEAIGRDLGVSGRTVGRRIAHLQARLGASSRFQLAVQAGRRGWI
ncbi:MAG: LuxR C-terminal-related transcriptional regulator [Tetrasphaera sp.]